MVSYSAGPGSHGYQRSLASYVRGIVLLLGKTRAVIVLRYQFAQLALGAQRSGVTARHGPGFHAGSTWDCAFRGNFVAGACAFALTLSQTELLTLLCHKTCSHLAHVQCSLLQAVYQVVHVVANFLCSLPVGLAVVRLQLSRSVMPVTRACVPAGGAGQCRQDHRWVLLLLYRNPLHLRRD